LRKGRDLIGLPILEASSGQRLGEVQDLVFDPMQCSLTGLLIDKGSWLHSPKQVVVESVSEVNGDGIKVHNSSLSELEHSKQLVSSLCGKRVATAGGKVLGSIQDVVIDESCFKLTGYEISDGFISDLVSGRAVIEQPSIVTQSNYVVVVDDQLVTIWDSQS
jgi:uncharacterized protein YrrD